MNSRESSEFVDSQEIAPESINSPLALLSTAIQASCDEADSAIEDIVDAVKRQAPEAAQLYQANKKVFVLSLTPPMKCSRPSTVAISS